MIAAVGVVVDVHLTLDHRQVERLLEQHQGEGTENVATVLLEQPWLTKPEFHACWDAGFAQIERLIEMAEAIEPGE